MKVMKEMVEVVNKNPKNIEDLGGDPIDIADAATGSNINKQGELNKDGPSQTCQNEGISLPNPEYLTLVKENKDKNFSYKDLVNKIKHFSLTFLDSTCSIQQQCQAKNHEQYPVHPKWNII